MWITSQIYTKNFKSENLKHTMDLLESNLEQFPNRLIINSAEVDFRYGQTKETQELIEKIYSFGV